MTRQPTQEIDEQVFRYVFRRDPPSCGVLPYTSDLICAMGAMTILTTERRLDYNILVTPDGRSAFVRFIDPASQGLEREVEESRLVASPENLLGKAFGDWPQSVGGEIAWIICQRILKQAR